MMTNQPLTPDPPPNPDLGQDPNPPRRGSTARSWFSLGLAIGAIVGLALGLLVALNGASNDTAATPSATPPVTEAAPPADDTIAPQVSESVAPDIPDGTGDDAATPTADAGDDGELVLTDPIGPVGDLATRIEGDPLALGAVDAPVVMVMYSDYRCPYCALFSQTLEQPLVDAYVTDGTMRIEWRDFPIFGEQSLRAAIAGRASAKQGKFWEFNKVLYAAAPGNGHPELPVRELVEFAELAGVADLDAFRADLKSDELRAAVQADHDQGSAIGVPATPSFVINGYPVRGAQPVEEFAKIIDAVLALQK